MCCGGWGAGTGNHQGLCVTLSEPGVCMWWVGCWDRKSSRFVCYTELSLVGGVLGQEIIKVCVLH